jgi:hypothetical protein
VREVALLALGATGSPRRRAAAGHRNAPPDPHRRRARPRCARTGRDRAGPRVAARRLTTRASRACAGPAA